MAKANRVSDSSKNYNALISQKDKCKKFKYKCIVLIKWRRCYSLNVHNRFIIRTPVSGKKIYALLYLQLNSRENSSLILLLKENLM